MPSMSEVIYLDYHASSPCDPRVVEAMMPFLTSNCANPSNPLHLLGRQAAAAVERARDQVAQLIGAQPDEIVFTSGATESNGLAMQGLVQRTDVKRSKLVVSPIEHKSVLEACKHLASTGYELVLLPVDADGTVNVSSAADIIDDDTLLVSVQAANNEVGTIQPVGAIAELAHAHGAVFHCDGAQAVGKVGLSVGDLGIDLLSISAHKLYGPKGVGALYVRGGATTRHLAPIAFGGNQERGLRPGTLNVPGIIGFGTACDLCSAEMAEEATRVGAMRDSLEESLLAAIPCLQRNGRVEGRLPGNSSLTFPGVDADALLLSVPELALSTGSACTSGAPEPSYVLTALGLSRELALSTIRVGLGRFTTESEVRAAAAVLVNAHRHLYSR